MNISEAFFVLLQICLSTGSTNLPVKFKRCSVKDVNFDKCMLKSVQAAILDLVPGLPELGIPPLDPLVLPDFTVAAHKGPVSVDQILKNVRILGHRNIKVDKFHADLKKKLILVEVSASLLQIEADYDLNGHILALPLQGIGHYLCDYSNVNISYVIQADEFEIDNDKYYNITTITREMRPGKVVYFLNNLFNGNEGLRKVVVRAMNDNWEIIFEEVHQPYDDAVNEVFKQIANKIFMKIPLKNIFIY